MPEIVKKQLLIPFDPPLERTVNEILAQAKATFYTLRQDQEWVDIEGRVWALDEMASSHLSNLKGYLIRHAVHFFSYYAFGEAIQQDRWEAAFGVPDDFDVPSVMDGFEPGTEKEWIQTTPLVRRVDQILEQRHRGVSFGEVVGG